MVCRSVKLTAVTRELFGGTIEAAHKVQDVAGLKRLSQSELDQLLK